MKKLKIYLCMIGFAFAFTSCGSGGDTLNFANMGENSSVQDVIAGKWKLTKRIVKSKNHAIKACENDNTLEIQGDGAYVFDNGVTQCNASETNDVGTWSLSDNDQELTFAGNEATKTMLLKSIGTNQLVAEIKIDTHIETHTYTKIQ
ncbi:lipocalin-like domain-containing protein [Microscilla marina]|nr:lipocalin family protein [Microscilla marina]